MSSDPLTQARDRIAELCGYVCKFDEQRYDETWFDGDVLLDHHPIPASLDFVSRVMDGQWQDLWFSIDINGDSHQDRLEAAFKRLLARLEHLQNHDRPAFDAAVEKIRKEIQG